MVAAAALLHAAEQDVAADVALVRAKRVWGPPPSCCPSQPPPYSPQVRDRGWGRAAPGMSPSKAMKLSSSALAWAAEDDLMRQAQWQQQGPAMTGIRQAHQQYGGPADDLRWQAQQQGPDVVTGHGGGGTTAGSASVERYGCVPSPTPEPRSAFPTPFRGPPPAASYSYQQQAGYSYQQQQQEGGLQHHFQTATHTGGGNDGGGGSGPAHMDPLQRGSLNQWLERAAGPSLRPSNSAPPLPYGQAYPAVPLAVSQPPRPLYDRGLYGSGAAPATVPEPHSLTVSGGVSCVPGTARSGGSIGTARSGGSGGGGGGNALASSLQPLYNPLYNNPPDGATSGMVQGAPIPAYAPCQHQASKGGWTAPAGASGYTGGSRSGAAGEAAPPAAATRVQGVPAYAEAGSGSGSNAAASDEVVFLKMQVSDCG